MYKCIDVVSPREAIERRKKKREPKIVDATLITGG